jgi:hypothetical protein
MPKFIVIHGSIKTGAGSYAKVGEEVDLSAEEAEAMPDTVATPAQFAALKAQADAAEKAEAAMKKAGAELKPVSAKTIKALQAAKKPEPKPEPKKAG